MTQEISFGRDFGEAVININGARLDVHADGGVDAYGYNILSLRCVRG